MGRRGLQNTGRFSTNRDVLAFSRSQCDGDHSRRPRNRIPVYRWRAVCPPTATEGSVDRTPIVQPETRIPRCRALGAWCEIAALALISHSAGEERGACAIFRGLGRRARYLEPLLTGRETPYAHGRGRAAGWNNAQSALPGCARTKPDSARRGRVEGRREADRRHSPLARAGRDRRYRPSVRDIARMPDCPGRARFPPKRERQNIARARRGRSCLQLLSVAPVFFETSATILDIAASISASVSVRSRGCRVT
jgi:hypothetical protein